jgi:hypothetical protein
MTCHPSLPTEPFLLIGPAEPTVADVRATLDALQAPGRSEAPTDVPDREAGHEAAQLLSVDRPTEADDGTLPPVADPRRPGGPIDQAPEPDGPAEAQLTRAILVLDHHHDDTTGSPSYATHNPADGTLLTGLTLDPTTLADLETPSQVTVTIEPGDRLNVATQAGADPAKRALTDVLLAERTVSRAVVAYAATDPSADLTTRMETALAEAGDEFGPAQNRTDL